MAPAPVPGPVAPAPGPGPQPRPAGPDRPVWRVMVVVGTRPEAVKLAPVVLAMRADSRFEAVVVATGQHRHLTHPVLDLFGIRADHDLGIGRSDQSLADVTSRALDALDAVVGHAPPDALAVQGDTTTALSAALAAFYHRVPVVHVEAGLRTGNRYAPYPEETNRRLITALATLHLAPTAGNVANLVAEGVARRDIVCTGNTVVDALHHVLALPLAAPAPVVAAARAAAGGVILVTIHRRESWGPPLEAVGRAVARVARAHPHLLVLLPAHPNPRVRAALEPALAGVANVEMTEPLDYRSLVAVMARSVLVLTDSGGIQEEAPSLGVPVLVLRDVTERAEALAAGTVELVGTDESRIVTRAAQLLAARLLPPPSTLPPPGLAPNPYGDGRAASRSVAAIAHMLGGGPPAEELCPPPPR
ncbi:MAG: non-hydrolyzing UDP-N-acetylglucosamine 2-epimerase [Acidimicrobiales bacterium]